MPGEKRTGCVFVRDLSDEDALALARLHRAIWPPQDGRAIVAGAREKAAEYLSRWREHDGPPERAPRTFFVRSEAPGEAGEGSGNGGGVVAKADVFAREVAAGGDRLTVMALWGVCVDPGRRGEGLARAVVEAAFSLVERGRFPAALFQTTPPVRAFYEKLGARVVANRVVNSLADDPVECPFCDGVVMRYPEGGPWPEGEIDILGPGY